MIHILANLFENISIGSGVTERTRVSDRQTDRQPRQKQYVSPFHGGDITIHGGDITTTLDILRLEHVLIMEEINLHRFLVQISECQV